MMNKQTQLAGVLLLAAMAIGAAQVPAGEQNASQPGKPLPRVLLIGDSIRGGYGKGVAKLLAGKAVVTVNEGNAQDTWNGLKKLDAWLGDGQWDLIHFNWGLWDVAYRNPESKNFGHLDKVSGKLTTPLPDYEKNLRTLVARLKQTGATLVWASTTPVPDGEPGRIKGDEIRYNAAAAKIMADNGIAIDDLHAEVLRHGRPKTNNVHDTGDLAPQVADRILAALAGTPAPSAARPDAGRPNVVLIIGDDQGFGDYGFMGHPVIKTPNLDRLAGESLLFTRGYVTTALCCPSLTTMLTGLYPHQHGYSGNDPAQGGDRSRWLEPFRKLPQLPALLGQAGYLSLHTGKYWQGNPSVSGFTDSMGETGRHGGQALLIGRQTMQPIHDFIAKAQSQSKPFLLWYAPFLPHQPHSPPERLLAKYRHQTPDLKQAKYFAMCEWLDETCGDLLKHIDDKGLRDNTVVIYLADNGWSQGVEGFRGSKLTLWEQGVRQPIMIRWPGKIAPRRDEQRLASNIDIAPTILAAAGLAVPPTMTGINLLDDQATAARKAVFLEDFAHDMAAPDAPEKTLEGRGVICGDWKLLVTRNAAKAGTPARTETFLFNLKNDPKETRNLAAGNQRETARLAGMLDEWWNPGKPTVK
jgi:uncharacterized sulfatase